MTQCYVLNCDEGSDDTRREIFSIAIQQLNAEVIPEQIELNFFCSDRRLTANNILRGEIPIENGFVFIHYSPFFTGEREIDNYLDQMLRNRRFVLYTGDDYIANINVDYHQITHFPSRIYGNIDDALAYNYPDILPVIQNSIIRNSLGQQEVHIQSKLTQEQIYQSFAHRLNGDLRKLIENPSMSLAAELNKNGFDSPGQLPDILESKAYRDFYAYIANFYSSQVSADVPQPLPFEQKKSVLIADDNPHQWLSTPFLQTLESLGYQFPEEDLHLLTARDKQTALDIIQNYSPDVILVDLNFPTQEEGLHIIRVARECNLTVVVVSAASLPPELYHEVQRLGVINATGKPKGTKQTLIEIHEIVHLLHANWHT